jgi:hypothetical protein
MEPSLAELIEDSVTITGTNLDDVMKHQDVNCESEEALLVVTSINHTEKWRD